MPHPQNCSCGSGLTPTAQYDARNIFLCYACQRCKTEKLAGYRHDILTDSNYECCEDIDADGDSDLADYNGRFAL